MVTKTKSKSNNESSLFYKFISVLVLVFILIFLLLTLIMIFLPDKTTLIVNDVMNLIIILLYGVFGLILIVASFIMEFTNGLGITKFDIQFYRESGVANINLVIGFLEELVISFGA